MSDDSPTAPERTIIIEEIVYLHRRMVEWQEFLDERPYDQNKTKMRADAKDTLENKHLVPGVEGFTAEVEAMSKRLEEWTRVLDAVYYLEKEEFLKPELEDARGDLKGAVKKLTTTVLALRERFYV